MNKIFPILTACMVMLYSQGSLAAIKCWTNSEGYRECGNIVPPEYAQKETRTLNKRGVTTSVKERAKTREELLREQQMISDKEQKELEEKRKKAEQEASDRVLLSTFLEPEGIIAARDRKIAVIDGYLDLTQITIAKLEGKLEEAQGKIAKLERQGKKISDEAIAEIKSLHKQVADKRAFILQKEREKEQLHIKYGADHKRFIELMNRKR